MADRIVMARKADRAPNWNKWRLIPNPTLWQCVALSLNIDPDKVHKEWLEINLVIKESRKFNDRIAVALANAGDTGALRPTKYTRDSKCWTVSLREFAAWVHRIGWEAPHELLAIGERPQNVNWDYWGTLDLWPLADACKLVCGADPEESTPEGDIANIANPNSRTRPPWVNVYHQAVSAIKAGNLSVANGEVTPAKFIAWVRVKGWGVPTELLAMARDQVPIKADRAHSGKRTDPATATREARKAHRLRDLKRFIDDVYEAASQGDLNLGSGNDRKALPFSSRALRAVFLERHPEHDIEQATFNDDLPQISVKVKPGRKRMAVKYLKTMLAGSNQG